MLGLIALPIIMAGSRRSRKLAYADTTQGETRRAISLAEGNYFAPDVSELVAGLFE